MIPLIRKYDKLPLLNITHTDFLKKIEGKTKEDAYKFYNTKSNKFYGEYNTPETKSAFAKMNGKRCSFCTKYISDYNTEMTVEHIEPKKDMPNKIFLWKNLLCSCRSCNTCRSTKPYDSSQYLNPTEIADIEQYFSFTAMGKVTPSESLSPADKKKAEYMIAMYQLNRPDLQTDRRQFFADLQDDDYYAILEKRNKDSMNIIYLDLFEYVKRSHNG